MSFLWCGAPEGCFKALINTALCWCRPLHSLNACGEKGLLAAWNAGPIHAVRAECCCLFHMEINAAECSQLPNKWLWLSLLHTKHWKTEGLWQWHGSKGEEYIECGLKAWCGWNWGKPNMVFGTCPNKSMSEKNHKWSCHNAMRQPQDNLFLLCTVSHRSPFILSVCNLGAAGKERICSRFVPTVSPFRMQCNCCTRI